VSEPDEQGQQRAPGGVPSWPEDPAHAAATGEPVRRTPVRHLGRRPQSRAEESEAARHAAELQAVNPVAHTRVFSSEPTELAQVKRSERVIGLLFLLSGAASIGFCLIWFFTSVSGHDLVHLQHMNFAMGGALAVVLGGIGAGFILWAKHLVPHVKYVQDREALYSEPEDQVAAEDVFLQGVEATGIGRRKLIKRTLGFALGLFPLPIVFSLRDLSNRPENILRHSGWYKDARLVDMDSGQPVHVGDIAIGGYMAVMPEGRTDATVYALAPTMLINLGPGINHPLPGRENWTAQDHIAYSRICTHLGCPVGLYETQDHYMLCPCHQSTFWVTHGAAVIFGPAARSLPQLPIYLDADGYFRARKPYPEPLGPSFWERGGVGVNGG
jgi:ubiquinol-cytochrome c reductase iron-sulfur subunit